MGRAYLPRVKTATAISIALGTNNYFSKAKEAKEKNISFPSATPPIANPKV